MLPIRLLLFGPPRLVQRDGAVALPFERRSQLLAHLALRRGSVPRTELAAMLWPQTPMDQAQANLRKTLFRLRSLPWAPAIVVQEHTLAFIGETDVADFEASLAARRWPEALEIAGTPLLAGFDDDASEAWTDWLRAERERLRRAWRVAAAQCLAAASDPVDVLTTSTRLLADDPLDETALKAQMVAYAEQGHPTHARSAYRAHAAQLAQEMGIAPSPELQALHDGLGELTAAPAAEAEPRIVGRTAERRTAQARLAADCRLLSLIGPGGVGKSSLARQLMSELAPRYPDGAVYVPLDDVESPDALGIRLARELAVPTGGNDPLQAVIEFLRGRRMLLVLDNFEHLRPAAKQLQALLDACPRVQMLVTSRVRLGLACEHLLPLDGLACPGTEDADHLESFDAVRLFVRAARVLEPTLQPAAESTAIVEICRLVDGLPLALEIAAAWTRMLSCEAIAAELRHDIGLLTAEDAARPARHASMAVVFEQSWQRLSPAERSTWARLTVFHGGFSLDAARAVTGASLSALVALTDQSLLRKTGSRADLHPLLRQLAASRLTDDEREATSKAHAAYYLPWLVSLLGGLRRGDKPTLQQVDVEFENVRSAWLWACQHGPADALQPAVLPLQRFCDLRGRNLEGLALLSAAQTGVGNGHARLGPLLEAATAHFDMRLERHVQAQEAAERALSAARATRDYDTQLVCLRTMGTCALEMGRLPIARRRYRQGLALAATDLYAATGLLHNLALVEKELGHYDTARGLYVQALMGNRGYGDVAGEALCLSNMGVLELDAGRLAAAATHLEASLALSERHALTITKMLALKNLTDLAVRRNDAAAAQRHGQRAFELASQIGARGEQTQLQLVLAQLAVQQRDLAAAREMLRAAAEKAMALDLAPSQLDCVLCLAGLLAAQGEPGAAIRLLRYAIDHPATADAARARARGRLTEWLSSQPDPAALSVPAVDLWTLLQRIVVEAPSAHASLIADLRTA